MAISDSIIRLIDGAISEDSLKDESFDDDIIDKVINYRVHPERFKKNPINYVVIRNMIASLTEWDKYKTFENYKRIKTRPSRKKKTYQRRKMSSW